MTETTIRRAELTDAGVIAEIYNEAIRNTTATFDTEPKTEQDRRAWLESHDDRRPVLVAERDGQVVGWGSLSKWSDRPAYADTAESSFYVAQQWRGLGIGRALKEKLIEEARRVGLHTILARVAEGNAASLHVNASIGFVPVGILREVGLKFGRRLDVHVLQLMLGQPAEQEPLHAIEAPSESVRAKQVIVVRHDLGMRRGKQIAQAAHASMSFLCHRLREGDLCLQDLPGPQQAWLQGSFAKVCCRVDSEGELLAVYDQAQAAGLEVHLITDSGKTEFHGQPTRTCLAIGPDLAEKIDAVTGQLQLL